MIDDSVLATIVAAGEAMWEKGYAYSIMGLTVQFYGSKSVGFEIYGHKADSVITLPRAICEAAALAVEP